MRRPSIACWVVVVALAAACKKSDTAADPAATGDATPAAGDGAVAVAVDAAPPRFPPLGAPPQGMDAQLAATCDTGDGAACLGAAQSFAPPRGYRAELTPDEADRRAAGTARYAQRACDLDHADGCYLAAYYLADWPDQKAALARGCELGHLGACGMLGDAMTGAPDTAAEGLALLDKACRGNAVGHRADQTDPGMFCDKLARLYGGDEEEHIPKDAARAKELKAIGCAQGFKWDCPCTDDAECGDDFYCFEAKCTQGSGD
jgi:hypothetical protein